MFSYYTTLITFEYELEIELFDQERFFLLSLDFFLIEKVLVCDVFFVSFLYQLIPCICMLTNYTGTSRSYHILTKVLREIKLLQLTIIL